MSDVVMRVQNVYGDFLRSFKVFLDRITRHSLNKIEWNYGSKTLEYYYMMNGHESFEYPVALVDIQDIQPVDGVGPIARNPYLHSNISNHQVTIAENTTRNEKIYLDKRWINLVFTVTVNTEDVASMLNYHDLFLGNLPMNFMFYDYSFYNYIEVTDFTRSWDFENDSIENVFLMLDKSYRYEPDVHYNESNENFKTTQERDRQAGRDPYPTLEGRRYFAMVHSEPILRMTSITKQTDKESNQHSIIINFEAQIEVPNVVLWHKDYQIESIEVVIDTVARQPQVYPILIDMPENFLTNKNISRGILLSPDNFVFPAQQTPPDLTEDPYLEVNTNIDLNMYTVALWAVENVTETSSSRFFIPLKHARVEYKTDQDGQILGMKFYFKEMEWFQDFDLGNPFNYLKLILFSEE